MKFIKFSLLIIYLLFVNSVHAQKSQSFKELNAGICGADWFLAPGASLLWGKTYQNNKRIFEWQA